MISWEHLIYFAVPALMLSAFAAWCSYREHRALALSLALVGIAVFGVYIALMWHSLERPPMRTMGETRLWYSFFALIAGLIVYLRWRYRWILGFSTILATVFVIINLLKPEIHNKSMMPALESPYFRAARRFVHVFLRHVGGCLAHYNLHSCTREKSN